MGEKGKPKRSESN